MATNSIALAVASRMNMREALIAPQMSNLSAVLGQLLDADHDLEEASALKNRDRQLLARFGYGYDDTTERKPFAFSEGVAIIPVQGCLINRCDWSWGGWITGYNFIRSQVQAAANDPDVESIILDVDSGGGEAAGCFELCDDIYAAREAKNIVAVVDSNCYSAAYAIASAAHKIIVTPSGGAGSIGVVATHVNMAGAMTKMGIEVTFVFAGSHKVDGNPFEALPQDVKDIIQANVDLSYDAFVAQVARNRGLSDAEVRATQAQCFRAPDALKLGLIDAIEPPSKALAVFTDVLMVDDDDEGQGDDPTPVDPEPNEEELNMTDTTNKPAAVDQAAHEAAVREAANAATVAERARVSGIMGSEEAKGRSALANHLAMNTSMSVDEAKAVLGVSAKEAASTAPVAPKANTAGAFEQSMAQSHNPDVGAEGAQSSGDQASKELTDEDHAARILSAQGKASGKKEKVTA